MPPERIQLSRRKGWRMPPGAKKVDRSTRWGNPFVVGAPGVPDVATAVARFRHAMEHEDFADATLRAQFSREHVRRQLAGLDLACWCPLDGPCHADVLIDIANAREPRDDKED
jgi:hypothetical protein